MSPAPAEQFARYSRHVERVMEHRVLGELLAEAWRHGNERLEVLRPDVDASGYDLVIGHGGFLRPVQLKTRGVGSTGTGYPIQRNLARYRGACVVALYYDRETFELKSVGFFGDSRDPMGPLPDLSGYPNVETKRGERAGSCELPDSAFERRNIPQLLVALFPFFGPSVAQASAAATHLNERVAAAISARTFELCCGDSHSLWRSHQIDDLHARMFEALLEAASAPNGVLASKITSHGVVVGTNVLLRRISDIQVSWDGVSLEGSKTNPRRIVIELARSS